MFLQQINKTCFRTMWSSLGIQHVASVYPLGTVHLSREILRHYISYCSIASYPITAWIHNHLHLRFINRHCLPRYLQLCISRKMVINASAMLVSFKGPILGESIHICYHGFRDASQGLLSVSRPCHADLA